MRPRPIALVLILGLIICGCSGTSGSPVEPGEPRMAGSDYITGRHMWGYWDISIDPADLSYEIVPRRDINFHLNARQFLEQSPCQHCLSLLDIHPSDHGTLLVEVEIRHPFLATPKYTGFDVRGIVILPGSREWPENGVNTSDSALNDGELLNPDGYTRIFNPVEYPPGSGELPILEYSHGTLASADPQTTLNAYKNFYSDANRRYLSNGDSVVATYDLSFPNGPILFGYAVDACWKPPTGSPPPDVPDDFPISANCSEAYMISAYQVNELEQGNSCLVEIDVYDWQGTDTIDGVFLEAPEVFHGMIEAAMVDDNGDWAQFEATVWEEVSTGVGYFDCLIRVDDIYDDPKSGPVSAYAMFELSVVEGSIVEDDCAGNLFLIADGNTFTGSMGEANAPLMENMIQFDAGSGEFADANIVKFYRGHNGYYNSSLTAMQNLVNSLGYTFVNSSEEPIQTDGCRMIVIYLPGKDVTSLFTAGEVVDLLHFLHNGGRILMVCDYTHNFHNNKETINDLLSQMGCTVYDDSFTNIPGIYVTDLADCPVMEGIDGFSMAANTRFNLGPDDMSLGYSDPGGGVVFCSTRHYN